MKKLFTSLQLGLIGMVAILATSCQREKLADVVKAQSFASVSASLPAKTDVATNGAPYTLTGADVTVPVTLTLSAPSSSAFTVNLSSNTDTVASLITSGVLPANTLAFPTGSAAVLPQISIPAGVTSTTFNVIVSRSTLELGFGKVMAAVIKVSSPTKGNVIASGKNAMVFTVKTTDILSASSIHDISFGTPTNQFDVVSSASNYTTGSVSVTISIPIILQGDPGAQFTVDVVSSPDSVTKYINNGTLANNVLYPNSNISIVNPTVTVLAGTNLSYLTFTTKIQTLISYQPAPSAPTIKMPTVAFTLKNPSKYQLTKSRPTTIYATINPNYFRAYYGTPFLIKGTVGVPSDIFYAAYYDIGGEGLAYHDNNTKDGDGGWRVPDYVDVSGDYSPRTVVGWTSNDEWLTYSVNVEKAGNYNIATYLGSPNTGQTYSVYVDNVVVVNKQVCLNTTNYSNQQPNNSTIPLTAGYHIFKFYWNTAAYDFRGAILTRLN